MRVGRILVVDDNPVNLKLVSVLLESEGHDVSRAVDAIEAQEVIRTNKPELVLMDIALPGMDGLTLTRLLKEDEATQDLIVIALTAFAMKGDEARARQAGCDGYITKPIDVRSLPGLISEHLERGACRRK
jgi:CheY-like chemotaxis protein